MRSVRGIAAIDFDSRVSPAVGEFRVLCANLFLLTRILDLISRAVKQTMRRKKKSATKRLKLVSDTVDFVRNNCRIARIYSENDKEDEKKDSRDVTNGKQEK